MPKACIDYGKYNIEVEGNDFVELLKRVAVADDIFADAKALAPKEGGGVEVGDNVSVTHRVTDQGHHYLGLRCISGPLKGYTREIGQYNTPRLGDVYTKRKPKDGEIAGYNGWSKYNSQGGGGQGGHSGGNGYGNQGGGYQQQPQQQQPAPVSNDDIPF